MSSLSCASHSSRPQSMVATALKALEPFFLQPDIVEVMVNGDGSVWVEEIGQGMRQTSIALSSSDIDRAIRLLATAMHSQVGPDHPSLTATLPGWGFRVQADVPPIVTAPVLCIRKPPRIIFTIHDYEARGILSPQQARLLNEAVWKKQNILVGGGTGSGKTTLVNALLQVVSETEDRVLLIEDTRELQCAAKNKVEILTSAAYPMRRAIMDALRRRPDRIIIGEVRDGSALELLKAWNTGHPGGLGTIHANDPLGMLQRLCSLIEEVVPVCSKDLVADAIDLLVHMVRDPEHPAGRRVTGLVEVQGYDPQADQWRLHDRI